MYASWGVLQYSVLETYFKLSLLVMTLDDPSCEVILEQAAGPGSVANEPIGPKIPTSARMDNSMIDMLNRNKTATKINNGFDGPGNKKLPKSRNRAHIYTSLNLGVIIYTEYGLGRYIRREYDKG